MGDEWVAGSYISKFALLTILIFFNSKNNNLSILFLLIFYFLIILFTGERMALLNYIFIIILFILFFYKKFFNLKKIIFLLTIIPIVFILFFSTLSENRQKLYTVDVLLKLKLAEKAKNFINFSESDKLIIEEDIVKKNTHLDLFISSIEIIKYNKFLGTGTDKFFDTCSQYNKNQIKIHCENHSHNTYLTILSEQGIFIFMIFLIIIFKDILLKLKINSSSDIHLIPFLILLTLINPISVSGDFFSTWTGTFFWFIFAIYSGLIQLTKKIK
jgi:O-antigen ligase